jgi:hypothetical protein
MTHLSVRTTARPSLAARGRTVGALLGLVVLCAAAAPTAAESYFRGGGTEQVTFKLDRSRSTTEWVIIGSLAGGAAAFGGLGLLFHLDSRDASNDLNAIGRHTGRIYDDAAVRTWKRAHRSRALAITGYSIGGGLLVASMIAVVLTEPGADEYTVGGEPVGTSLLIAPAPGGAMVTKGWTF